MTWHFLAISCRPLLTPKVFKLHGSSLRSLNTWSSFLSQDFYTAQDQRTLSPLFRSSIAYTPSPPTTRYVTLLFRSQRNSSALPITDLHLWFRSPQKRCLILGMLSLRSPWNTHVVLLCTVDHGIR